MSISSLCLLTVSFLSSFLFLFDCLDSMYLVYFYIKLLSFVLIMSENGHTLRINLIYNYLKQPISKVTEIKIYSMRSNSLKINKMTDL